MDSCETPTTDVPVDHADAHVIEDRSIPHANSWTIPQAIPRSIPRMIPHAIPRAIPHAIPQCLLMRLHASLMRYS